MKYNFEAHTDTTLSFARQIVDGDFHGSAVRSAIAHICGCMIENLVDGDHWDDSDITPERIAQLTIDYLNAEGHEHINQLNRRFITEERALEMAQVAIQFFHTDQAALDAITHPHRVARQAIEEEARQEAGADFSELVESRGAEEAVDFLGALKKQAEERGQWAQCYKRTIGDLHERLGGVLQLAESLAESLVWEEGLLDAWDDCLTEIRGCAQLGLTREAQEAFIQKLDERVWPAPKNQREAFGIRRDVRVIRGVLVRRKDRGDSSPFAPQRFTLSGPGLTTSNRLGLYLGSAVRSFEGEYTRHSGTPIRYAWRTGGIRVNPRPYPAQFLRAWGVEEHHLATMNTLAELKEGETFRFYAGEETSGGTAWVVVSSEPGDYSAARVDPDTGERVGMGFQHSPHCLVQRYAVLDLGEPTNEFDDQVIVDGEDFSRVPAKRIDGGAFRALEGLELPPTTELKHQFGRLYAKVDHCHIGWVKVHNHARMWIDGASIAQIQEAWAEGAISARLGRHSGEWVVCLEEVEEVAQLEGGEQ